MNKKNLTGKKTYQKRVLKNLKDQISLQREIDDILKSEKLDPFSLRQIMIRFRQQLDSDSITSITTEG